MGHGDAFEAGGFQVEVYGEWHAVIHPDIPRIGNVGFLIEEKVFHPGDAFTVPERAVDTLMVPISGPWQKAAEAIDYVRAVRPARAYSIHDEVLSETGKPLMNGLLGPGGPGAGTSYERFSSGDTVQIWLPLPPRHETREVLARVEAGRLRPATPFQLSYAIVSALSRDQDAYVERVTS